MKEIYNKARNLRKNSTPQELKLWNLIRDRKLLNLKFKRQVPMGKYIADFCCNERMTVIEIDGGQHNEQSAIEYDNLRTQYLISLGYKVIRFWNNEIDNDIEGVYLRLLEILDKKK